MKYEKVIKKLREAQKEIPALQAELAKVDKIQRPAVYQCLQERIGDLQSIDGTIEILQGG